MITSYKKKRVSYNLISSLSELIKQLLKFWKLYAKKKNFILSKDEFFV
jgi:hypothetical protein